MISEARESRLAAAFVSLADTLVVGYDVVDLLQTLVDTCAELLDASAAGLLLANPAGELEVVAATSEQSRLVEMMQAKTGLGPCVECFRTGAPVAVPAVAELDDGWQAFRDEALRQGFNSVHAVPLRLRGTTIGALGLFGETPGLLSEQDASVAQGLADVATIGILHERALRESDIAQQQLQRALNSRVVIEQAKGVIAQTHGVDMDEAFRILRAQARSNSRNLRDIAELVVERKLVI